jgi:retinol dehydrogenase-14
VLFTNELARRLEGTGVTANAVHPGVVGSDFGQREGGPFAGLMKVAGPLLLTPARGARTSIHVASSPVVEGVTGRYFARSRPTFTSRRAGSAEDARRLWELSEALTGVR